jgi:hypothetical protein
MESIVAKQFDFFSTGDEAVLKPMKMKLPEWHPLVHSQ